jgi:hypothetical protein
MEKGKAHGVLVGKPQGGRPLEEPNRRNEDNIKMYLKTMMEGCELHLPHERNQWPGSCEHGNEPLVQ